MKLRVTHAGFVILLLAAFTPSDGATSTSAASISAADRERGTEEIRDLLRERWFFVEIVVFERLDVLEFNVVEDLVRHSPRAWPHNLTELVPVTAPQPEPVPLNAVPPDTEPPDLAAGQYRFPLVAQCRGYPSLPIEDPVHPSLLPDPAPDPLFQDTDPLLQDADAIFQDADASVQDPDPSMQDPDEAAIADSDIADNDVADDAITDGLTPAIPLPVSARDRLLRAIEEFEGELVNQSLSVRTDFDLTPHVKAINRQRTLRPLLHQRWLHAVPPRASPATVLLSAQQTDTTGIEGFLNLSVGRYLHIAPTIWYHAPLLGQAPVVDLPGATPMITERTDGYLELEQSRRLRSEELHYIDHPKLGVLVQLTPIEIPDALLSFWVTARHEAQSETF